MGIFEVTITLSLFELLVVYLMIGCFMFIATQQPADMPEVDSFLASLLFIVAWLPVLVVMAFMSVLDGIFFDD